MIRINKKILGMFVVVTFIIGVCFFFSKDLKADFFAQVAYGNSLESSSGSANNPDKISSDLAFLSSLKSLKSITIDTNFFSGKVFGSLVDNSVNIEKIEPGRPNPFAPIGSNVAINKSIPISNVATMEPTQVTETSVMLNGVVNITDNVTDLYFNYGKTDSLGTIVSVAKPSLVGSFVKNISGLTPKTNYSFKACAKINNIEDCGSLITFSTK